ncbi:hypothetical protein FBEOM_7578 [Fusarium beomiforme]|uniref:Uncharacterized protein n=1 Tax=Fusarium beomiforme TaxID=44412 RepID=A0A9P5AHH3_9HYPO|nr:hypothetical protein FBEOM_7578 [Fusarium beomiforme]
MGPTTSESKGLGAEPSVPNDPIESNSILTTPHSSLKHKMKEEIYDHISKKMKPYSQVFRVAGRAGLVNPIDFDVEPDGTISLSKQALKKVYPNDNSKTSAAGTKDKKDVEEEALVPAAS